MKTLIVILVLLMSVPCFARSKKSQAKLDARHAQAAAVYLESEANLNNAKAGYTRQVTRQRAADQQYKARQRGHQRAQRQRNTAKRRGSALIGF
jgi:hypothetical protein